MKRAFKKICLICTVLIFIPLISSLPLQIDQKQLQKSNAQNKPESPKNEEEIFNPSNWIARGGCWDFSDKIIYSQGYRGACTAYFKERNYKNFSYEVRVMKIAEDGPLGLIFHYDDVRDEGYYAGIYPHGSFFVQKTVGQIPQYLKIATTAHLNNEMNTWNTLKIEVRGSKIDCYINGNFLVSIIDNTYSTGKIGLWNCGDPRQIGKFEIISIRER
jgi:hypothetical protein